MGHESMDALTTGQNNTAVGTYSLGAVTTGNNNVGMGYAAIGAVTTESGNTAFGHQALEDNTADNNTAVGLNAAANNTTGTANAVFGRGALDACTTGGYNNAFGYDCLTECTTGSYNVAMGTFAGNNLTTGGTNTFMGYQAGHYSTAITTGTDNTCLGAYSHASAAAANGQIVLGYNALGNGNRTVVFGYGADDTACDLGGTTWSAPSDVRLKEDIQDEKVGLDFINELRPVTFRWKKEKDIPEELNTHVADSEERVMNGKYNHGFVAQEVKEVIDKYDFKDGFDMWKEDPTDGRQRVGESALMPIMVKAVQELSAKVEELEDKLK